MWLEKLSNPIFSCLFIHLTQAHVKWVAKVSDTFYFCAFCEKERKWERYLLSAICAHGQGLYKWSVLDLINC